MKPGPSRYEEVMRCTCTWWRSWSRCASECGRWWRSGRGGGAWDCRKNSERPKKRFEVWKSFGRICHRFGRIWIGRVRASGTFEDNSIYFESAEECLQTRAVFSGMLTDVVKIFETSPHSVGEEGAGLFTNTLYKTQSHPSTDKNFGNVGANVENYFSSSAWQLFSSWKPVQNLSYTVNFFHPRFTDDTQLVCVNCAEDTDSYRKNAKMTYYLFCPPFHSESKELTTERTT